MSDMPIDPNLQENEDAINMAVVSGIVARIPFYSESRVKGKRQQYAAFTLKCRKYLKNDEFDEIRIKAYGMNAIYIKENLYEGMEVVVKGALRPFSHRNEEDKKVWLLGVLVEDIEMIDVEIPTFKQDGDYIPIVIPQEMIDEMPFA